MAFLSWGYWTPGYFTEIAGRDVANTRLKAMRDIASGVGEETR
jgi:hypothetical protein